MADNYYIVIDREKVFVSEEVYKTYRQMKRQERTLAEKDARNGLISYEMGAVKIYAQNCLQAPAE